MVFWKIRSSSKKISKRDVAGNFGQLAYYLPNTCFANIVWIFLVRPCLYAPSLSYYQTSSSCSPEYLNWQAAFRVELGAGGGLVGLAVARGCSVNMPIYITDQESMLPLMEDNIKINGLSPNVRATVLNWGRPLPASIPTHPAVVLAADCVYFEPAFPLLISTLEQLLGPESVCYFCFKRRRRADMRCIKQIKKIFDVVEIRDYADYDTYARDNLFLYKIKSRNLKKGWYWAGFAQIMEAKWWILFRWLRYSPYSQVNFTT